MARWIKIYDSILEWGWHTRPETVSLFIHLLVLANTKDKEFEGITIKRGELLMSQTQLAKITGLTRQNVRTCLKNLETTGELTRHLTSKGDLISISKYELYQAKNETPNQAANQRLTSDQPAPNQRLTTTLEFKDNIDIKDCCSLNAGAPAPEPARESEGFSFYSLPGLQQEQEQQQFLEIFFFNNITNLESEVQRFIATNERHKWMNKSKTECYATTEQRCAIARLWHGESRAKRVTMQGFLPMWKKLYQACKESGRETIARLMLDERVKIAVPAGSEGRKYLLCHEAVFEWLISDGRSLFDEGLNRMFGEKTKISLSRLK